MKKLRPTSSCDLIMKGGTTSGTLYPKAIQEIMKKYRLVNVGGTSAGAIAAAAAAAAEIGRDAGSEQKLDELSKELPEKLLSFFQPRTDSRFLFNIGLVWLDTKTIPAFLFRMTTLWAKQYKKTFSVLALLIFLSGLCIGAAAINYERPLLIWMTVAAILFTILYGIAWLSISIYRTYSLAKAQLSSDHGFGLCPGAKQGWTQEAAFTDWFGERLNDLAGIDGERPLTFGDLAGDPASADHEPVNLVVMTTSITDGSLIKVPFEADQESEDRYLFREADWAGKIPADVLSWLIANSQPFLIPNSDSDQQYYRLPENKNLPVILAVRMSMSFPLLFTTTKLYKTSRSSELPQEVVFTDGGVTSNFPIHFFDSIWPSRPTFGITLDRTNSESESALTPEFGIDIDHARSPRKLERVGDFVSALFSTMQNWTDDQQSSLLSARQRIVHIPLSQEEGGLNLTMPQERIKRLIERGQKAGEKFCGFELERHRWTRYVSSMVSFAEATAAMQNVWTSETPDGHPSMQQFVQDYIEGGVQQGQSSKWQEIATGFAEHLVSESSSADAVEQQPGHNVEIRIVSDHA